MARVQTVDEYLDGFTGQARELLEQLRALAREQVPGASVAFTPSTREAFDAALAGFDTGKGSVKLPYGRAVPTGTLRRMIAFRVSEHEADGVLWM